MSVPFVLIVFVGCSSVLAFPEITPVSQANRITDAEATAKQNIEALMKQVENLLQDSCQKFGVKEAGPTISMAVQDAEKCFPNVTDIYVWENHAEDSRNQQDVQKICELFEQRNFCANKFVDSVGMCLGKDRVWLKKFLSLSDSRISFWCSNKAENMNLFINERGVECVESKLFEISNCSIEGTNKTESGELMQLLMKLASANETGPFKSQYRNMFSSEGCKKYDRSAQCVFKQLQTCDSSVPAKLAESFYNTVIRPACSNVSTCVQTWKIILLICLFITYVHN